MLEVYEVGKKISKEQIPHTNYLGYYTISYSYKANNMVSRLQTCNNSLSQYTKVNVLIWLQVNLTNIWLGLHHQWHMFSYHSNVAFFFFLTSQAVLY